MMATPTAATTTWISNYIQSMPSVAVAMPRLRRYARTHGEHLTEVSRRLLTQP